MSLAMFGADPQAPQQAPQPGWLDWLTTPIEAAANTAAGAFQSSGQQSNAVVGLQPTTAYITDANGNYVPVTPQIQALTAQMATAMDNANQAVLGIDTSTQNNAAAQQAFNQQLQNIYGAYLAASGSASASQYQSWINQVNSIEMSADQLPRTSNAPTVTGSSIPANPTTAVQGPKSPSGLPSHLDPSTQGANKTPVTMSTADQIQSVADSIFGAVDSGAKSLFTYRATQLTAQGKPVNIPQAPGSDGGGLSTNAKIGIGVAVLAGVGILAVMMGRKR